MKMNKHIRKDCPIRTCNEIRARFRRGLVHKSVSTDEQVLIWELRRSILLLLWLWLLILVLASMPLPNEWEFPLTRLDRGRGTGFRTSPFWRIPKLERFSVRMRSSSSCWLAISCGGRYSCSVCGFGRLSSLWWVGDWGFLAASFRLNNPAWPFSSSKTKAIWNESDSEQHDWETSNVIITRLWFCNENIRTA